MNALYCLYAKLIALYVCGVSQRFIIQYHKWVGLKFRNKIKCLCLLAKWHLKWETMFNMLKLKPVIEIYHCDVTILIAWLGWRLKYRRQQVRYWCGEWVFKFLRKRWKTIKLSTKWNRFEAESNFKDIFAVQNNKYEQLLNYERFEYGGFFCHFRH